MIGLLICLTVIALTVVVLLLARRHEGAREARRREARERELARTGLSPTLGSSSWAIAGIKDGVQLAIESDTGRPLPGGRPGEESSLFGTLLQGKSPGPDVIVCRRDLTDAIAGPLSTVPRRPTGDAAFDRFFDVLSNDGSLDATSFPPPEVRLALADAGLVWLRRKDGLLELMTRSLTANQASALVAVGVALCRPELAREAVRLPLAEIAAEPPSLTTPLYLALGSLIAVGPAGAMLFSLFPPVQSLFLDLACPTGFTIEGTSSTPGDGSTYYGAICRHGADWCELSTPFFLACGALTAAIACAAGLWFSARRAIVWRREPA